MLAKQTDHSLPPPQAVYCKEKAFIYNECIACCPASCQSRAACVDSEIACVDGCYCPNGLLGGGGGRGEQGGQWGIGSVFLAWMSGNQGLRGCLFVE